MRTARTQSNRLAARGVNAALLELVVRDDDCAATKATAEEAANAVICL